LEDMENDPGLKIKLEEAKEKDEKEEEEIKEYLKPFNETSDFNKIFKYNNPIILIPIACLCSAAAGFTQPFLGVIFAKVMNLLTVPVDLWAVIEDPDYLQTELNFWVLMTCLMAVICFVGFSGRSAAFGFIGQNVTLKIRNVLYEAILTKDIGFFDKRENNSSVLTSIMA